MTPSDWFIYEILLKALTSATQFRFYPLKVFSALERFCCVVSLLAKVHECYETHEDKTVQTVTQLKFTEICNYLYLFFFTFFLGTEAFWFNNNIILIILFKTKSKIQAELT